uniref:3-dehydroquinate synthase N-terminal domain-containing protein n=1 Tax=Chaetoceros debilis TaxID=122233 RepID=A0A7S3VG49_9STRA|mmetsp:Transcript_6619/g.9689  ORF Transcript_6619/g.9689 Transcript_6619/m.9689 type:complete len:869 (+) Transcript_6619:97-2703(+)
MALFLPPTVEPLASASNVDSWNDQVDNENSLANAEFFKKPIGLKNRNVEVDYVQLSTSSQSQPKQYLQTILDQTPKPKGRNAFTSIHVVGPHESVQSTEAEETIQTLLNGSKALKKEVHVHRLNKAGCQSNPTPMQEYNCIFEAATSLLMAKADRASILVFVGCKNVALDAYAAFIGLLPFRGVQVALLSQRQSYGDLLRFVTSSGTFDLDGLTSARMGKFSVHAVFGELPTKKSIEKVRTWYPVDISSEEDKSNVIEIPFKIGGLTLPMLTHNGSCDEALECLAELLKAKYPKGFTPIVSCGETCDALGYGQDMLDAMNQEDGMLYSHKSGETYKRYDNYATDRLLATINKAKSGIAPPVVLAVGGGVNGNCIGLVAGMTNCDFIEVPTTPMHYNDAVTSAKKAFSLVVEDKILSKNILGCFYLPQLAFCVNEWLLTISTANAHATVGEATKTMNMLGVANSMVGANDFRNITGAVEFASDFTKILEEVEGFDNLVEFIESSATLKKKKNIISIGKKIAALRDTTPEQENARSNLVSGLPSSNRNMSTKEKKFKKVFGSVPSMASLATLDSDISSSESDSEQEQNDDLEALMQERKELMKNFRASFYNMSTQKKDSILSFLTTINREIVCAKAMFLAYSDPFEKYRALLFEYAHTLGHGVEAFANDLYLKARKCGVDIAPEALRLHGQCVGMAVLWAGEMSKNLGKLTGEGYTLHQSFPYLFNRNNGFSFGPLRELCDELGVDKEEFVEKVLQVVRRDNKRGYCACSDPKKSVDQLVTCRPGKMLSSPDPNAEIRYLVEVDEDWQGAVLAQAFDGYFDKVADLQNGEIKFLPSTTRKSTLKSKSKEVAKNIRTRLISAYKADESQLQ